MQIAEYAMDPLMLAKYKAAVRAVHAKRAAKENLAEAEKKRRRAAFEAEMADLDVQDATLESSQSYEDEPPRRRRSRRRRRTPRSRKPRPPPSPPLRVRRSPPPLLSRAASCRPLLEWPAWPSVSPSARVSFKRDSTLISREMLASGRTAT